MFEKVSLQDWENLVKKQLKTEDFYATLTKENLENISVKPYYDKAPQALKTLPKVEESTHLVAKFQENLEEDAFAFCIENEVSGLSDKTFFITNKELAKTIHVENNNQYLSLIDVFPVNNGEIDQNIANELLQKNFKRNIAVDVSLHQNAGASIIQQLAFALAKSKDLAETFGKDVLKKLVFKFAVGGNYFFEIAKIRSFKILYHQLCKEYGLEEIPYIFVETSLRNKSKSDAENNLIRSTLEISSAMIAGADAVFTHDFKIAEESELSAEISFKQQIVLAYESIINVFEDASNGSYYIEDITKQLAEKSWKLFLEIEEKGGYLSLLNSGELAKMIYNHATEEQKWVDEGKIKLIGVNLYPKLERKKSAEQLYSQTEIKAVRLAEAFE